MSENVGTAVAASVRPRGQVLGSRRTIGIIRRLIIEPFDRSFSLLQRKSLAAAFISLNENAQIAAVGQIRGRTCEFE